MASVQTIQMPLDAVPPIASDQIELQVAQTRHEMEEVRRSIKRIRKERAPFAWAATIAA
jgi:hypothetical protein